MCFLTSGVLIIITLSGEVVTTSTFACSSKAANLPPETATSNTVAETSSSIAAINSDFPGANTVDEDSELAEGSEDLEVTSRCLSPLFGKTYPVPSRTDIVYALHGDCTMYWFNETLACLGELSDNELLEINFIHPDRSS